VHYAPVDVPAATHAGTGRLSDWRRRQLRDVATAAKARAAAGRSEIEATAAEAGGGPPSPHCQPECVDGDASRRRRIGKASKRTNIMRAGTFVGQ
jgi:hypothetical protein